MSKILIELVKNRSGLLSIFAVAALFHALAYYYVAVFYRNNLPHYDSIGSYTVMFEIINSFHAEGFAAAFSKSLTFWLSWLQSLFALFGAFFLSTTPEGLQLLNSIALLAFMLGVYAAAKSYDLSETKAFLLALMVFLPDVFYDWWGGVIDMRRDFTFVSFLGATFFMFFALVRKPGRAKSVMLGLLAGLTVYSRDASIFFLAIVMGPIVLAWLVCDWRRSLLQKLQRLLPAFAAAMVMVLPWLYANIGLALARRLDPFVMYGTGDRWESFMSHWAKPLALMFGRLGRHPSGIDGWSPLTQLGQMLGAKQAAGFLGAVGGAHATLPLTILGLLIGGAILWKLRRIGYIQFHNPHSSHGAGWMVAGGAWALVSTYIVICYVVALKPLDYSSSQIPFFPSLLFFFSLLFALGIAVSSNYALPRKMTVTAVALVTFLVFLLAILRMEVKAPEPSSRYVGTAHRLAEIFDEDGKNISVAYLWHDTISYDTLRFYSAASGASSRVKKFLFSLDGTWLDFAVAVPAGVSPEKMLHAAREQIEQEADYVVLCKSEGAYDRKENLMFLFKYGQPMVDALIRSEKFKQVFEFEMYKQTFVVLKRR